MFCCSTLGDTPLVVATQSPLPRCNKREEKHLIDLGNGRRFTQQGSKWRLMVLESKFYKATWHFYKTGITLEKSQLYQLVPWQTQVKELISTTTKKKTYLQNGTQEINIISRHIQPSTVQTRPFQLKNKFCNWTVFHYMLEREILPHIFC